ncbi:hypothetical protein FRC03_009771 [Tulasnella sp. 419]|nr:hypothetical protein FRC03_009771 [Tulasnella sp. 419]
MPPTTRNRSKAAATSSTAPSEPVILPRPDTIPLSATSDHESTSEHVEWSPTPAPLNDSDVPPSPTPPEMAEDEQSDTSTSPRTNRWGGKVAGASSWLPWHDRCI